MLGFLIGQHLIQVSFDNGSSVFLNRLSEGEECLPEQGPIDSLIVGFCILLRV
jgi:hypothetical protein